jgi:hypothetical protein
LFGAWGWTASVFNQAIGMAFRAQLSEVIVFYRLRFDLRRTWDITFDKPSPSGSAIETMELSGKDVFMKRTLVVMMLCFSSLAFAGTSVAKPKKQNKTHRRPPASCKAPLFRFMHL